MYPLQVWERADGFLQIERTTWKTINDQLRWSFFIFLYSRTISVSKTLPAKTLLWAEVSLIVPDRS